MMIFILYKCFYFYYEVLVVSREVQWTELRMNCLNPARATEIFIHFDVVQDLLILLTNLTMYR